MEIKDWKDMSEKYPEYRDEMSEDRQREFVQDCFNSKFSQSVHAISVGLAS